MSNDVMRQGHVGRSPIFIGRFTYGFENMTVRDYDQGASLKIGSFCSIGSQVNVLLGGDHMLEWMSTFPFGLLDKSELGAPKLEGHRPTKGDVLIGDDVWIGHGVTILSGVTIGTGAVLAANANVVKDVEPYAVVGGNPAKEIKKRFSEEIIDLLFQLKWWDFPVHIIREINQHLVSKPSPDLLRQLIAKYRP